MDNGATRTFTYKAAPAFQVGDRVHLENGSLIVARCHRQQKRPALGPNAVQLSAEPETSKEAAPVNRSGLFCALNLTAMQA